MWNLFICSDTYKIQDKHKNKRFSHNASFSLGWRKTHYIDVALNFWSPFPASQGAVMKTRPLSISLKNIKLSYLIYVNVFPAWMYMHQRHACCWLMNDRSYEVNREKTELDVDWSCYVMETSVHLRLQYVPVCPYMVQQGYLRNPWVWRLLLQ